MSDLAGGRHGSLNVNEAYYSNAPVKALHKMPLTQRKNTGSLSNLNDL